MVIMLVTLTYLYLTTLTTAVFRVLLLVFGFFPHFLSPLVEKLAKSRVNEVFSSGQMQTSPIHAIFDPF